MLVKRYRSQKLYIFEEFCHQLADGVSKFAVELELVHMEGESSEEVERELLN